MDPNLKQRIIDEAYVLFLTKGMKQTSFCDVAAAVHKSKGAVMHYFSSKRHLIDTVVKMRFFPASQLSPEMDYLEGRRWDEFLRSYKNPIERVIVSIRPRACFFPLFSFLPLWLHYNLNPLCVQY